MVGYPPLLYLTSCRIDGDDDGDDDEDIITEAMQFNFLDD